MWRKSQYVRCPTLSSTTQQQQFLRTDVHPLVLRPIKPTILNTHRNWFQFPVELTVDKCDKMETNSIRGMWHLPSMHFSSYHTTIMNTILPNM